MRLSSMVVRVLLSLFISALIGFEREKNRSSAGIRTHALVGVAATIITIIQVQLSEEAIQFAIQNPDLLSVVRSDPARLTAQIISGIGFLGAGTIIVTKRNISGLTTAASIWSVAALGIAVGFGYYDLSIVGTATILGLLFITKKHFIIKKSEKVIIRFILSDEAKTYVSNTMERLHINATIEKYDVAPFGDSLICTTTYILTSYHDNYFNTLVDELSERKDIISIQTSNL